MMRRHHRRFRWGAVLTAVLWLTGVFWPAVPAGADEIGNINRSTGAVKEPMQMTIEEAVLLSLENNLALVVEKYAPAIAETYEDQGKAVFDPRAGAEISVGLDERPRTAVSGAKTGDFTTDTVQGVLRLEQFFPTGTLVAVDVGNERTNSSSTTDNYYTARIGMTVSQALLRGFGLGVNLADVRQANLDTRMSAYELRGFTEFLVAEVESTCWDYLLANRQIEIFQESLKLARQQLGVTEDLISVGRLAEAEIAAVRAEVALHEQGLINAASNLESIRLRLLRLINPPGEGLWERQILLMHRPVLPEIKLEAVEQYVAVSQRMRPELNEARLGIRRNDLELVKTKNGMLPLMTIFITLGKTGYVDAFGDSFRRVGRDGYDAAAGITVEYPFGNREAKSRHRRALLSREQAEKALGNLCQLVEVDVRSAYIEVNRTRKQIAASSSTRIFNEEKRRIEAEKFRVGRSTSLLVAQVQRDLLISRIAEVQAVADYLKALVNLYRMDGSLLERRGISIRGRS